MKKQEFLEKWAHVNLSEYRVEVGEISHFPYDTSIYEEDGVWKIAEADEYHHIDVIYEGTEEEMFERMDKHVKVQISFKEDDERVREEIKKLRERRRASKQ